MNRFYAPRESVRDGRIAFTDEEKRHIAGSRRHKSGDTVAVLDGKGSVHEVLLLIEKKSITGKIISTRRCEAPATRITLYQSVLKNNRMHLLVEKAAELGVSRIVPVITSRTVPLIGSGSAYAEKLRKIAVSALKQSGRFYLAEITDPARLSGIRLPAGSINIFAHEKEDKAAGLGSLDIKAAAEVNLFIGPEGGFSEEDYILLKEAGCLPVSLGPSVMRSETAAIYMISILNYLSLQ